MIPDDVRAAIYELVDSRPMTEEANTAAVIVMKYLQPAEQWVPVEVRTELDPERGYSTLVFDTDGTIEYCGENEFPLFPLPDDLRLCRRV